MFGALRLALALLVAWSHAGVAVWERHLGVPAVVVFFILSGFVVASLLDGKTLVWPVIGRFYQERLYRLLPLYGFFALLALLCRHGVLLDLSGWRLAYAWLANVLVVPLNYQMFAPWLVEHLWAPPAWSLGLELQFYALAPWVLRRDRWLVRVFVASVVCYALASLCLAPPYVDWVGYRFLPGNVFMFLTGALLYRARHRWFWVLLGAWCAVCGVWVLNVALGRQGMPFVDETAVGYVLGAPLVAALSRLPRQWWDERLGHLAYGVFLCHFLVLWGMQDWLGATPEGVSGLAGYSAAVLVLAGVGHVLAERPLTARRYAIRCMG